MLYSKQALFIEDREEASVRLEEKSAFLDMDVRSGFELRAE